MKKHFCEHGGWTFFSDTRHRSDVHCFLSHQPFSVMKNDVLHGAMRHCLGAFSSCIGKNLRWTKRESFERNYFEMEECYPQTASDVGSKNDICERKRTINLNCDGEGKEKERIPMLNLCEGFQRLCDMTTKQVGSKFWNSWEKTALFCRILKRNSKLWGNLIDGFRKSCSSEMQT